MIGVRRSLGAVAAVAVLALAAVACGSSSSHSGSSSGSSSGSTPGSTTSNSTPPPTSGSGSGSGNDTAWCSSAKKWQSGISKQIESAFAGAGTDPTKLKTAFGKLTSIYEGIVNAAPGDIKPSVEILFTTYKKLVGILQKNNFNYVKAAPALEASQGTLNSPQVKAAENHIKAWAQANGCT